MTRLAFFLLVMTGCRTTLPSDGGPGGDGGGGAGDGGAAPTCDDFADEEVDPDTVVTVRLVNNTGDPIYIGATSETCEFPGYVVENETGEHVTTNLLSCMHACSSLRESGCGCFLGCETIPVVYIEPGGAYEAVWQEKLYTSEVMPASCYADPTCIEEGDRCFMRRVPVESLVFVGAAYPSTQCSEATCACEPDASGSCEMPSRQVEGEPREARSTWNPGNTSVEIVFD